MFLKNKITKNGINIRKKQYFSKNSYVNKLMQETANNKGGFLSV